MTYTETDFDSMSWHDCHIWAIERRAGDPESGDWTSDLALDIDFIGEWICVPSGRAQFRVAPAIIVFHGVTDPRINIDWGRSGFQVSLHPASIDRIEREPIENQKVYLDRAYYRWRIGLNWPDSGEITFGAVGFTQTLRAEAVVTERQYLSRAERKHLQKYRHFKGSS
jgi:hypothetical protein